MNKNDILISIKEASRILNTLKGEVYELINNNKISSIEENNRTFVYLSEINEIKKKNVGTANPPGFFKRILENIFYQIISFIIICTLCLFFSLYFFYPELKVLVKKDAFNPPDLLIYTINISNISAQDIYNFDFSIRFDEKNPVKEYGLKEINYKSGIKLRSMDDLQFKRVFDQKNVQNPELVLMSGLRGSTGKFPSGTVVSINVKIDNTYTGDRGDVFPPMMIPSLRPKSYYLEYNYRPFGITIDRFFKKKLFYDFNNEKSKPDYYKKYRQKIPLLNGQYTEFEFEIGKK